MGQSLEQLLAAVMVAKKAVRWAVALAERWVAAKVEKLVD